MSVSHGTIDLIDTSSFEPDREELAWAAGFFDGEGCFSYNERGGFATATIIQVDRRVVDRFRDAVGLGKVYGPYEFRGPDPFHRKPQFQYRAYRRADVHAIVGLLWFKLGPVKRAQAARVLRKLRRYCSKGHVLTQARGCPRCVADAWQRKRSSSARAPVGRRRIGS